MYNEYDKPSRDSQITKWLPRISLIIGICAILFQITVLYPWHLQLSREFATLAGLVKNHTR